MSNKNEAFPIAVEARALTRVAEVFEGMPKEQALRVLAMLCIIFEKYDEAMPIVQALSDGQLGSGEPTPSGIEDT